MVYRQVFVDREQEVNRIVNRIKSFPLPSNRVIRDRFILIVVGPKGIGKSTILRRIYYNIDIPDTYIAYIDFKKTYTSVEDLFVDFIRQLYSSISEYSRLHYRVKDYGLRVLKYLVKKILGEEFIDEVVSGKLELFSKSKTPGILLSDLILCLAEITGSENKRLALIIDEFQELVKTFTRVGVDKKYFTQSFIHFLSKTQEWGIDVKDVPGYVIPILTTSDYSFYTEILDHSASYIEPLYISDLDEKYSKELLVRQASINNINIDDKALDLVYSYLGGNPLLLTMFIREAIEEGVARVDIDTSIEIIKEIATRIAGSFLTGLSELDRMVLKVICRHGPLNTEEIYEYLDRELLRKYSIDTIPNLEVYINRLIERNILYFMPFKGLWFQNRLLEKIVCEGVFINYGRY